MHPVLACSLMFVCLLGILVATIAGTTYLAIGDGLRPDIAFGFVAICIVVGGWSASQIDFEA